MEWKGHQQRQEVGPREGQDPSTNVEGQGQRKELWKGQASEKSARPRKGKRAKTKTRKVSRVENPTMIGKVYAETIPVIPANEIHTLFRAFQFVQLSPMASVRGSSLFLTSHVEVCLQVEFMSCTVYTMARCLVGWNAQRQTPFQRQRTTRFEPSHPSHSRR